MMQLKDRVAVVTGGGSGIGLACMTRLRAEGVRPVAWDVADGDISCDVSDEASVREALHETVEKFGVPTLLVASAGVAVSGLIVDMDIADWDRCFSVNIRGVMLCVRGIARAMIERQLNGAMVIVSSVNGIVADPGTSAYSATKAACHHFGRVAARELGPHGIRINSVGPGPTETPMLKFMLDDPRFRAEVRRRTPLNDVGSPARIADAIVGLMGMDWVTGQCVMADGGSSLNTGRGNWQASSLEAT